MPLVICFSDRLTGLTIRSFSARAISVLVRGTPGRDSAMISCNRKTLRISSYFDIGRRQKRFCDEQFSCRAYEAASPFPPRVYGRDISPCEDQHLFPTWQEVLEDSPEELNL
jgi:hypothetical protein